jgi:hypothetical protein
MELRSQKAIACLMLLLSAAPAFAVQYRARHQEWYKPCDGVLTVTAQGVSFHCGKKHSWKWTWDDIEQMTATDQSIRVITYQDRLTRLGADEEERFVLLPGQNTRSILALLRQHLGQKFVEALAGDVHGFEIPAKRLGTMKGVPGVLVIGGSEVVFRADAAGNSRTWHLADIDNIARTGPYSLTIVTFERGRREFNFQLKRPLPEAQYEALWLRLNQNKGLKILTSYKEKSK